MNLPETTEPKGRFVVICIEGCHGSGKTSLVNWFQKMGFLVLDEGFMQDHSLMHPQSFTMEFGWVWTWFSRLLSIRNKNLDRDMVVVADRSPYSAVFYARGHAGGLMKDSIAHMIDEVKTVGIDIFTVKVHVDRETLLRRIAMRLEQDPRRIAYNEHKEEWNHLIYQKYQDFEGWDMILDNSEERKRFVELAHKVIHQVQEKTPNHLDLMQVNLRCREFMTMSPMKKVEEDRMTDALETDS